MRDMLEARKRGDLAFRDKDFRTAIDCYSQVLILTSFLMLYVCSKVHMLYHCSTSTQCFLLLAKIMNMQRLKFPDVKSHVN